MRLAAAFLALTITAVLLAGIPALILGHERAIWHLVQQAEMRHPWLRLSLELVLLPLLIAGLWLRGRRRSRAQRPRVRP